MDDFNTEFEKCRKLIEDSILSYIPEPEFSEKVVYKAMAYAITNGGKRIRPVLTLEFCKACGGNIKDALPFACAVEMIHCYSLVHDDLPCMDDDDLRRGKPSCHIMFGEANALLAGDGLLTSAFQTVLNSRGNVSEKNVLTAASELAKYSGHCGMIGGQTIDIFSEGKEIDFNTLKTMHSLKTGALIAAACKLGCLAAGADESRISAAVEYAENIGMAFQITDDVLDAVGNTEELGKTVGKDASNSKPTFVSFMGVESSEIAALEFTENAKNALSVFGEKANFLRELADFLVKRKK